MLHAILSGTLLVNFTKLRNYWSNPMESHDKPGLTLFRITKRILIESNL